MRKILTVVIATAAFGLTACGSEGTGGQDIEGCTEDGFYRAGCVVEIDYNGKPLTCLTWDGSHDETGLTCDFVKYHSKGKK